MQLIQFGKTIINNNYLGAGEVISLPFILFGLPYLYNIFLRHSPLQFVEDLLRPVKHIPKATPAQQQEDDQVHDLKPSKNNLSYKQSIFCMVLIISSL